MKRSPEGDRSDVQRPVGQLLAAAVAAVAGLVLLGWAFGIGSLKTMFPGFVAMNPVTAFNFLVLAAGLFAFDLLPAHARIARCAGVVVGVVALVKILEILFNLPVAIDQVLFQSALASDVNAHPNQMAPNTAVSQLLLGAGLALRGVSYRGVFASEVFAATAAIPSAFALVGYAYGIRTLYRVGPFIPMALHTALAVFLAAWALLLMRADHLVARRLFQRSLAAVLTRRLLPAALFLPPLLGWLRLEGERQGLYPTEVGVALFALVLSLMLIALVFFTASSVDRLDRARLRVQAQLEEVAVRLVESNESLERLATFDALTGVMNRRACLARLEAEAAASARHRTPLSVLMIDADHFKAINDGHGHETGDQVLIAMAQALTQETRASDQLSRYGGEEFCMLLPHTTLDGAMIVAERCCAAIRALDVRSRGGARVEVRCSIGVATSSNPQGCAADLVHAADKALYAAKAQRDCVRCEPTYHGDKSSSSLA